MRSLEQPYAPAAPLLPPEARLEMPAQGFWRRPDDTKRPAWSESDFFQIGVFSIAGVLAIFGGGAAYSVLQVDGLTPLELVDLVLFQILFTWIAYALANALIGFGVSLEVQHHVPTVRVVSPAGRTAILMPVHNEDPKKVTLRLRNMDHSLRTLGAEHAFDFFLLSDTCDPDIRREELAAFENLRRSTGQQRRMFYRLRPDNTGRKAGNIADWVRRFGGAYDYMLILDADSVMDGETLLQLAASMDAQPGTGLIQTVPRLVNRISLFGRVQQFANRLYGPMLSAGLAHTSGAAGNYWGHNAIIRVAAFAAHAGLPRLRGPRPFGGDILSHDFVEAALLRRAGWEIRLSPQFAGSYEECPPTLPDMIVRERRWCQGNLQHMPLIAARGLHWMSRIHLAQGVLTYLMPPIWLLFLFVGAAVSAEAAHGSAAAWDDYTLDMVKWLLAISLVSLLIPRALALFRALARSDERKAWGSPVKLIAGILCETLISALMAPIMMTAQATALVDIALGRDSGWAVQQRADGSLGWKRAARRHLPHTAFGVILSIGAAAFAPAMLIWMTPVILGLLLAIPFAVLTSDPALGAQLKREGLFVTPEERSPPMVLYELQATEPRTSESDWRMMLDRIFENVVIEPKEVILDT